MTTAKEESVIKAAGIAEILPLSPLQTSMLVANVADQAGSVDLVQQVYRLPDDIDLDRLASAWQRVVRRHGALRARFRWRGLSQPVQIIDQEPGATFAVEIQHGLDDFIQAQRHAGMNLERGPLVNLTAHREGSSWRAIFTFHHAILDGWSAGIVLSDLASASSVATGSSPPLASYFEWLSRQDHDKARAFWSADLADVPPSCVATKIGSGLTTSTLHWQPDEPVAARLADSARRCHLTLSTVVQTCWAIALAGHLDARKVVFGVASSGRDAGFLDAEMYVGMLLNTIPSSFSLDLGEPYAAWAQCWQRVQSERLEYQWLPLHEIRARAPVANRKLFDTVVSIENYPHADLVRQHEGIGLEFERTHENNGFPVSVSAVLHPALDVDLRYDSSAVSSEAASSLLERFAAAVTQIAQDPARPLGSLEVTQQRHRQLAPAHQELCADTLDGLVGSHAHRTPHAVAVQTPDCTLTYAELNARADRVARQLRRAVGRPGSLIGVYLPRTSQLPIALLGVLKSRNCFLPLDPHYPPGRLSQMIGDSGISTLITSVPLPTALRDAYDAAAVKTLFIGDIERGVEDSECAETPAEQGEMPNDSHGDVAYAMFTSGSTGIPSCVPITHRAAANHLLGLGRLLGVSAGDTVSALTPISFDPSVREIFGALVHGATLALFDDDSIRVPRLLGQQINQSGVTVIPAFVPSVLQSVLPHLGGCSSARVLATCGEPLSGALAGQVAGTLRCRVLSLYGPTESTMAAAYAEMSDPLDSRGNLSLGRPLPNYRLYVFDHLMRSVPRGAVGQIHIGGLGVCSGFRRRPGQTAAAFLPEVSDGAACGRMYATGDLGHFAASGELIFDGRRDNQVKINGVRVDLSEIESALNRQDGVEGAAVTVSPNPQSRLTAFVVASKQAAGRPVVTAERLRRDLRQILPSAVVPGSFQIVEALPRLPNGKLDRRALTERASAESATKSRPPITIEELRVSALWSEILGHAPQTIDEDFFAVGGDSLQLASLWIRLREELTCDLTLDEMFDSATIRRQATACAVGRPPAAAPTTGPGILMPIRRGSAREPDHQVLAFHDGTGSVAHFARLSALMDGDAKWAGIALAAALPDDLELGQLFDHYARLALDMAERPLWLVGYSFGGVLAAGVSERLSDAGIAIAGVVLLDCAPPGIDEMPERAAREEALKAVGIGIGSQQREYLERAELPAEAASLSSDSLQRLVEQRRSVNRLLLRADRSGHALAPRQGQVSLLAAGDAAAPRVRQMVRAWESLRSSVHVETVDATHHSLFNDDVIRRVADFTQRQINTGGTADS